MIKVLLVDDEYLALQYLENIIDWQYYGFELVGVTTNPEQAFSIYKRYRPELVISDVRMPGKSGLELVNAIREYGGNTHILFLSAYKSFDYVMQAIRLGIDDYLLKSDLEEESFLKKILNLKEVIHKEKAKDQYTISSILEEIFQKDQPEERYKKILSENAYIRLHKKYYFLLLNQKVIPRFLEKYISREEMPIASYEYEFKDICQKYGESANIQVAAIFPVNEREYLAVLDMNPGMVSQKEIRDNLFYYARKVFQEMNQKDTFHLYFCDQRMSVRQFGSFYEENKGQLSQGFMKKEAQLLELRGQGKVMTDSNEPKSVTSEEIIKMIRGEKKSEIQQCIQTVRKSIEDEDFFSYFWYVKHILEAISAFEGSLSGEKSWRSFSMVEGSNNYDLKDPSGVTAFIEFKIHEIWLMLREKEKTPYSEVILKAMSYIQANYDNPEMTAAMVADSVGISNSWLSTKFKEEVRIGVSDFINNIRIEQAKQMFAEKDYMVYEVSEQTGFTSSQYFSRIFKEYTGMTPNQYRRKITGAVEKNETEE